MPFVLLYLVVEIVALVALASWIGVGWTLLVLVAGSVLGLWLARREGMRAVRALAEAARDRRVAHVELTDGLLVAMGGLLLVVPGLVTDVAGLLLLLPPTRSLARRRMVREAERRAPGLRNARIRGDGTVVDGSVVDGSVVDGSVVDGSVVDGSVVDGTVVDDDTVVEVPDSARSIGPVVEGQIVEGEIVDGPDDPGGSRPLAS
jgi:UPF0716 protein FxsA